MCTNEFWAKSITELNTEFLNTAYIYLVCYISVYCIPRLGEKASNRFATILREPPPRGKGRANIDPGFYQTLLGRGGGCTLPRTIYFTFVLIKTILEQRTVISQSCIRIQAPKLLFFEKIVKCVHLKEQLWKYQ